MKTIKQISTLLFIALFFSCGDDTDTMPDADLAKANSLEITINGQKIQQKYNPDDEIISIYVKDMQSDQLVITAASDADLGVQFDLLIIAKEGSKTIPLVERFESDNGFEEASLTLTLKNGSSSTQYRSVSGSSTLQNLKFTAIPGTTLAAGLASFKYTFSGVFQGTGTEDTTSISGTLEISMYL